MKDYSVLDSFIFFTGNSDLLHVLLSIPLIPRVMCKVRQDGIKAFHWQKSLQLSALLQIPILAGVIHILIRYISDAYEEPDLLHLMAWVLGDWALLPEWIASCLENSHT